MKKFLLLIALMLLSAGNLIAQSAQQYQMIVSLSNFNFPGPVLAMQDANGEIHNVLLETTTLRFWIQDFSSLEDCQSSVMYQNVPMIFTNALGVASPDTLTANFVKCEKQPA